MKRSLILSIVMFAVFIIASCNDTTSADDLTKYEVVIINVSSSKITNIELEMTGVENNVTIDSLAIGENTPEYEFLLPLPEDDSPISYGDYSGSYIQEYIEKDFAVIQPELSITILINDDSFSYE